MSSGDYFTSAVLLFNAGVVLRMAIVCNRALASMDRRVRRIETDETPGSGLKKNVP